MNWWTKAFLVALRIVIGWHFLYEGLWKIDSDTGSTSYTTSWYVLQSSVDRLRADFDHLPAGGLERGPALERIDAWYDEVVSGFSARGKSLSDEQKARLTNLCDQVKIAAIDAARRNRPGGTVVNFDWIYVRDETLKIVAEPEGERFTSLSYLEGATGPFRSLYRGLVPDVDGVKRLTVPAAQAAIDGRYQVILKHYSSAGHAFTPEQRKKLAEARDALKTSIAATLNDPAFQTRLADYKLMQKRVSSDPSRTNAPFTTERLAEDRGKLDVIAGELLRFVDEPLTELSLHAERLATEEQLRAGPLPRPGDESGWIDHVIKFLLIAIGICLLLGLFTPVAAVAAAAQLAVFYFASPPWPGLPAATLGGQYLYVDRNLIEMVAACVIATTATGRWAGLDAYLGKYVYSRRRGPAQPPVESTTASPTRSES